MMAEIKPIETEYGGYRFRSRLEARWAVFFDECGWKWEYETEGYDLEGVCYLPDFILHDVWIDNPRDGERAYIGNLTVETKGPPITEEDYNKVRLYQKYIGPILVLGDIPNGKTMEELLHNICENAREDPHHFARKFFLRPELRECDKCSLECIRFGRNEYFAKDIGTYRGEKISDNVCSKMHYIRAYSIFPTKSEGVMAGCVPVLHNPFIQIDGYGPIDCEKTISAFKTARQARFEHGETPRMPKHEAHRQQQVSAPQCTDDAIWERVRRLAAKDVDLILRPFLSQLKGHLDGNVFVIEPSSAMVRAMMDRQDVMSVFQSSAAAVLGKEVEIRMDEPPADEMDRMLQLAEQFDKTDPIVACS